MRKRVSVPFGGIAYKNCEVVVDAKRNIKDDVPISNAGLISKMAKRNR